MMGNVLLLEERATKIKVAKRDLSHGHSGFGLHNGPKLPQNPQIGRKKTSRKHNTSMFKECCEPPARHAIQTPSSILGIFFTSQVQTG